MKHEQSRKYPVCLSLLPGQWKLISTFACSHSNKSVESTGVGLSRRLSGASDMLRWHWESIEGICLRLSRSFKGTRYALRGHRKSIVNALARKFLRCFSESSFDTHDITYCDSCCASKLLYLPIAISRNDRRLYVKSSSNRRTNAIATA